MAYAKSRSRQVHQMFKGKTLFSFTKDSIEKNKNSLWEELEGIISQQLILKAYVSARKSDSPESFQSETPKCHQCFGFLSFFFFSTPWFVMWNSRTHNPNVSSAKGTGTIIQAQRTKNRWLGHFPCPFWGTFMKDSTYDFQLYLFEPYCGPNYRKSAPVVLH